MEVRRMEITHLRTQTVEKRIENDIIACDLQLSLLVAAARSYRHDTVLRPFPAMFIRAGSDVKEYRELDRCLSRFPSLVQILKKQSQLSEDQTNLIHWVLDTKNFQLKSCDKACIGEIQEKTGHTVSAPNPNFIFEVEYNEASEEKFNEKRQGREVMYAYHGTRVENFHSILNHGLHGHFSKNALFGEGTYLSAELSVCMPYASTGSAWDHSVIGDKLSCIAVCEMIDDPSVKCQIKEQNGESTKSRAHVKGSLGGEVPEKYYVVRNNEMIRIKYILVYAEKTKAKRRHGWSDWLLDHKFTVMILCYVLLLVVIGLYNSRSFHYYIKRYWKR